MNEHDRAILLDYTRDALDILAYCLKMAESDCQPFYRVAALQMRLLLCDTTRRHGQVVSIATIPALLPNLRLSALDEHGSPHPELRLPLGDWLAQSIRIGGETLSARQLIRRVCDQDGGAHVDSKPVAGLPARSSTEVARWVNHLARMILAEVSPLLD